MKLDGRSIGIDCLRAGAMLAVVLYHFVSLRIFRQGFYGVGLFFVISGYCMFASVKASTSAWDFYSRRLGRLLPALIVCAFLTTLAKHLFPTLIDPGRVAGWRGVIESIIALPTANALGLHYSLADGAYWSLVVEFNFYILCAVIIIFGLAQHMILAISVFAIAWLAISGPQTETWVDFFPFFIAGASIAAYQAGEHKVALAGLFLASGIDIVQVWLNYQQPQMPITLGRTIALWASATLVFVVGRYSAPRWLAPIAFIGLISYPAYLLHQDIGIMFLTWADVPYSDTLYPRVFRGLTMPALTIAGGAIIFLLVERPLIGRLTKLLRTTVPFGAKIGSSSQSQVSIGIRSTDS